MRHVVRGIVRQFGDDACERAAFERFFHGEQRINGAARVLTADEVAHAIEDGMCAGAASIAPGLEMKVLARLGSVIEPALNWYQDTVVNRVRRERSKEIGD